VKQYGGEDAAKNFQTALGETQRVVGGVIGNPLLGGGETDARLKQATSVWGANPTVKNLVSTGNVLKEILNQSRQSLMGNNRYLRQRYGGESVAPATAQPTAAAPTGQVIPPGAVSGTLNGQRGYVLNGKFTAFASQ
jgi:hypothetical protein